MRLSKNQESIGGLLKSGLETSLIIGSKLNNQPTLVVFGPLLAESASPNLTQQVYMELDLS
jgi:hypothetical protein